MKTFLDWSAYKDSGMGDAYADIPKHGGDYAKAIAVCINSRQCEAEGKQVMCPSFKVTGNPNLSTGGRVKLLKAALSSDSHQSALLEPELAEAMDLCVSCKGCKRECENNVDMPLIKAEYLAQKRAAKGSSLRSALFAQTPVWLHKFPWLRFLIAVRNRSSVLKLLSEKIFGLSSEVNLPQPTKHAGRWPVTSAPFGTSESKPVVIFADTFSRHFDQNIVDAAIKLLSKLGYQAKVLEPGNNKQPYCCGRTFLAQGMVSEAKHHCERLIDGLLPFVEAGIPIVGLEASCMLGLRDDAKAYGLGDKLTKVADATLLFEEFLARESKKNANMFENIGNETQQLLIHGHCHQKAVGAMKSVRRLLKLIPKQEFTLLDSGCCGMAGTFGLEQEHATISRKMADLDLIPSLNASSPGVVIANGFSCRQQIKNLTELNPKHLVQYLAEL